ncbi:hypothetical protein GCM10020331_099360 [Ectobacillus funiculus]
MAIGAIQAIEEYGLKPGKDITIISIDGVKGAFEAMMDGKLNASIECNPLLGEQLMQAIKDVKAGKEVPKWIKTEEGIFLIQLTQPRNSQIVNINRCFRYRSSLKKGISFL